MTTSQQIITVLIVVLGTILTRSLPFLIFPEGKTPPRSILYLGTVLPYAVIGLLVVYCMKDALWEPFHGLPEAIAVFSIILLHKWKKTLCSVSGPALSYTWPWCRVFFDKISLVIAYDLSWISIPQQ